MSRIACESWSIESVSVNGAPPSRCVGFEQLQFKQDQILIMPAELIFKIAKSDGRELVLVSQEQTYFGVLSTNSSQLRLKLSRQEMIETVEIIACSVVEVESENVEREVVQV